jgi:hypothetical protein
MIINISIIVQSGIISFWDIVGKNRRVKQMTAATATQKPSGVIKIIKGNNFLYINRM